MLLGNNVGIRNNGGVNQWGKNDLNFSSQNVRSLNIATKNKTTEQKILAITKYNNDIILLCDLRLNSQKQKKACEEIEKKFSFHGYSFIHNSKNSLRGVGILIKEKIYQQMIIHRRYKDEGGNILLLDIEYKQKRFTVGSVYGCNTNEGIGMYDTLKNEVQQFGNESVILGGDWNLTLDIRRPEINLDILNMADIPSRIRSNKVIQLCNLLDLTDP